MTTVEEFRLFNYEISQAIAPTWERRRSEIEDVALPVREWMVRELDPRPGQTVLELAAGAGDTGFEVARRIGPEGRLITSDFAPAMLDAARRRGAELEVENVDYRVVDAESIDLGDDSVDAVICRYGYMLMADPPAALAETRRVLRPGGRLALAVWGRPERNPFFAALGMAMAQRGHIPPPDPDAPGLFSMASPERTASLLRSAGFDDVRTEEVPVRFSVGDVDDYLAFVADTAGPIAMALRRVPADEREGIKSQLEQAFAPFKTDRGHELPGVTLTAVAR